MTKKKKDDLILPNAKDFLVVAGLMLISYLVILIPAVFFNSTTTLFILCIIFLSLFYLGTEGWSTKRKNIINKFITGSLVLPFTFVSGSWFLFHKPLNQTILMFVKQPNYLIQVFGSMLLMVVILSIGNNIRNNTIKK